VYGRGGVKLVCAVRDEIGFVCAGGAGACSSGGSGGSVYAVDVERAQTVGAEKVHVVVKDGDNKGVEFVVERGAEEE
jgi:hypothetical protein